MKCPNCGKDWSPEVYPHHVAACKPAEQVEVKPATKPARKKA